MPQSLESALKIIHCHISKKYLDDLVFFLFHNKYHRFYCNKTNVLPGESIHLHLPGESIHHPYQVMHLDERIIRFTQVYCSFTEVQNYIAVNML